MSSGTIKAGTFGQRRWREAQIKTQRENRQREATIKKEIRKATKGKQRRAMPRRPTGRPVSESWREVPYAPDPRVLEQDPEWATRYGGMTTRVIRGDPLSGDPGGGRPRQQVLRHPLGRGGAGTELKMDDRGREIQQVVNTMPLKQDNRYIMQIRDEIARQEGKIADDPEEWEEMDVGDIQDALHYEAGEEDEEGNITMGASGRAQPEKVDELPEWAGGGQTMPELPDEMTEPTMGSTLDALSNDMGLMGMDEDMEIAQLGQAMASANVDVDEDDEEWERKLDEIAGRTTPEQREHDKALMKAKIEEKRAKRGAGRELSKPDGDREPSMFIGGLAPSSTHDLGHRSDLYQREKGQIKYKSGKAEDRTIQAPQLTKEGHELYEGRIMDVRPGYAGKDIKTGTRSRAKLQTPVHKATSRPVKEGLITAVDRVEYIFDEKSGQTIKNPNFGKPIRVEPHSVSQAEGAILHPKTRKPLRRLLETDKTHPDDISKKEKGKRRKKTIYEEHGSGRWATGDVILEKKTYSSAKTQKPVEELWGLDRKGMSREEDNPPTRDAWEGRRAISKDPKKRGTKQGYHGIKAGTETAGLGEKDVKAKQYQKEQREKDPNYRPSDLRGAKGGFNYGSGVDNWSRKDFDEYQSTPATEHRDEVENEDIDDATLSQLKSYAPQDTYRGLHGVHKVPKFPSRPDRPARGEITNPPMNDLQATNPGIPKDPRLMQWAPTEDFGPTTDPAEWHQFTNLGEPEPEPEPTLTRQLSHPLGAVATGSMADYDDSW